MADSGRKDLTSQVSDKITPESQKSTTDKIGETASNTYDRAAGALQPESEKSTTQKVGDSVRGGSDDASKQGKSALETVQDTVNSGLQSAQEALGLNQKK